jgi:hypothetical protein
MVDGAEYVPTNVKGEIVEPFVYNGTTYLPVRAVANAFNKDVEWDGTTSTVYIGKKDRMMPDTRLDKLQYIDYREDDGGNDLDYINGTVTDFNGRIYTNGILFRLYNGKPSEIDYPLNGKYSLLSGTIVLPKSVESTTVSKDDCRTGETDVVIYGDDEEIFRINGVTSSMPYNFDVSVEGTNFITIRVDCDKTSTGEHYIALTDVGLYE